MMEYKILYAFEVMNKVRNGEQVSMVDREEEELWNVNSLTLEEFAEILNTAENEPNRYEFWIRKETE